MKRFLVILALGLVILAKPTWAQDNPTLSNLELALWPEFDRSEVLVIYRGRFAPDTSLPVPVEIRIPAHVGLPTAVAYVDEEGQRFNQEHETRVDGDWLAVSFELPTQGFQLEYYDTLPTDSEGQRTYTYSYTADYPITVLDLEFQVPPTAQAFVLDPPATEVVEETDGLTYHLVQAGSVDEGETQGWTFTYFKPDSALTAAAFVQVETPEVPTSVTPEGAGNSNVLIFLFAFVALVAVGAGAFWLGGRTQSVSQPVPPPPRQHKRRGSGRAATSGRQQLPLTSSDEALFCYKCGTQLRHDSDFCHKCGAAIRKG